MLLLFVLPNSGRTGSEVSGMEHGFIKKSCAAKRLAKRACVKGCLKHQTHSDNQQSTNTVTDCSQTFYAVVAQTQERSKFVTLPQRQKGSPVFTEHLPPYLKAERKPPRFTKV
ncbi:hypothetical protein [uncultured Pontibacter sp.]|uniref:hypothetical protein n=1 Tax=uncultured Pontibacter sp. TaxID=453356 RepID=UPI00261BBBCC|nr:hypothetical protein [uncultured Pontibacter sp.]